jgi:hypothetical protein
MRYGVDVENEIYAFEKHDDRQLSTKDVPGALDIFMEATLWVHLLILAHPHVCAVCRCILR